MDPQIESCVQLTPEDHSLLLAVEAGLLLTADISRADILLCTLLDSGDSLIARHAAPESAASIYREDLTGTHIDSAEQPVVLRALNGGRGGRLEREVKVSRAPVIQDVYPVYNDYGVTIGVLAVEFNMFAYERQRGRSRVFQDALRTIINMCARGELSSAEGLTRFGLYDGMYLVDRSRVILYMSSVADNLYRSAGVAMDAEGQSLSELESMDAEVTDAVFATGECVEMRKERPSGRIWIRKGIPLRSSADRTHTVGLRASWYNLLRRREPGGVDSVLVLLHNATENVQKQRELNVKSALIQEVHHRVKNNLQSVAAILRIQARRAEHEETRQQLSEAVNRILSVAVIHEFLGEGEERLINIRDLADRVAGQVGQVTSNPDQNISINVKGPSIRLPAGQATPVAMVINELMLNALEHGLEGYVKGSIVVNLEDLGNTVRVTVENSGGGLPPDFDPGQSSSLGLQIVNTLVKDDLKGELTMESLPDVQSEDQVEMQDDSHVEADEPDVGEETSASPVSGARAVVTFPKRSLKVD